MPIKSAELGMRSVERGGQTRAGLVCCLVLLGLAGLVRADEESRIIDGVFREQERMEQEIDDAVFQAEYIYAELDAKGDTAKTINAVRRVSMKRFERQRHDFLRMSRNGRELSRAEMNRELVQWRLQEMMIRGTRMPFTPKLRREYEYQLLGDTTWFDLPVRRIGFRPRRPGNGHVRGEALVHAEDSGVVQLRFRPALLPFVVKDMGIVLDYDWEQDYWLPWRFRMWIDIRLRVLGVRVERRIEMTEDYSDYSFNNELDESDFE